ncbi:hypothetical protein RO3G_09279 [Rhizopus delemar RA 99-880]|uniref:Tc1-like transposase DDE domain-containing protein n=1 Tax=Rhizopus delemar (strain RA 99-880 / ATCC MYA-4621 / FGSC 9543 / NRRL 43880) TaxID=246409 RepID=I1C7Y9_RHIO9|nr:hypothetical protein RO3G_09279 [Rhizopus delemar RA 99-880]|eukprot:EIE84569.1 hypothetical protein RO3G_09279 [Rhizopus delemar RA 99-880]
MQDIKAKIDNYGSPLPHKHTGINTGLAKLDVFVSIETLRSYVDQRAFKSYRAAHKPRLTARHRKSRPHWAKEHNNWAKDQWRNVAADTSSEGDGGTMVWGCFWGGGFGPLETIDTDSWKEIHQIRGVEYWSAQSPDLNPIEHVWNALERQIERKKLSVKNLQQLKVALQKEWARLDHELADPLVQSMKRRYEAIIKNKSDATEH